MWIILGVKIFWIGIVSLMSSYNDGEEAKRSWNKVFRKGNKNETE